VQLRGAGGNTQAIGARLRLTAGSRMQIRDVKAGSSYLSQNDLRTHFGLGAAARADRLEVLWPSGRAEAVANVPANQIITIEEGRGIVAQQPFSRGATSQGGAGLKAPLHRFCVFIDELAIPNGIVEQVAVRDSSSSRRRDGR
jgi:ASPIC and UnbV